MRNIDQIEWPELVANDSIAVIIDARDSFLRRVTSCNIGYILR